MSRDVGRGVLLPYTSQSAYHDNCIPKHKKEQQQQINTQDNKNYTNGDYSNCDEVTTNKIWKQSVESEKRCIKSWEENWGFLAEFDPKGRPKTPQELPEKASIYSEGPVPNTNAGNYGGRLNTDVANQMQALEFRFYSERRRRKIGDDLICY
ncbi:uncharacterized protein C2orf50-like isoform X2 [Liolophura sinensis]|uniref:uncharacterized protein C2orf50-like isoform X2 n=1 Tax=Liolophura sinensis TaxID=3198878 RepID=UPI0031591EAC